MSFGDLNFGQQFFQQRSEFEFGEELAEEIEVGFAGMHGFDIEFDGNVGIDGGHAFAEENNVAIIEKRFAVGFLFHFGGAIESFLHRSELPDDFDGALFADAGGSGDVVDGVAAEGHDVDDALGRDTENFFDLGGVADEIVFGRIQDLIVVINELHHVFVAADDVDGVVYGGGFSGQGADYVVGLEAREFENRNAVGFECAANVGNLLREVLWHCGAVGFVSLVFDFGKGLGLDVELADFGDGFGLRIAEGLGGDVEDCGEIVRGEIVAQFAQHVYEVVGGGGGQAGLGGHGALPRHGVIGAEDVRHGVDEEDAVFGGLRVIARGRRGSGGRAAGDRVERFFSWRQENSLAVGKGCRSWAGVPSRPQGAGSACV